MKPETLDLLGRVVAFAQESDKTVTLGKVRNTMSGSIQIQIEVGARSRVASDLHEALDQMGGVLQEDIQKTIAKAETERHKLQNALLVLHQDEQANPLPSEPAGSHSDR